MEIKIKITDESFKVQLKMSIEKIEEGKGALG